MSALGDLQRNDVDGAVRVFEAELDAGTWGPDKGEVLLMLQDDSDELLARLAGVIERRRAEGRPVP